MAIHETNGLPRAPAAHVHDARRAFAQAVRRIAGAKRVAGAADDSAATAGAGRLRTELRALNQARRSVNDGLSLVRIADQGVAATQRALGRIRELSLQACDAALSDGERAAIQMEIEALRDGVAATAGATEFAGEPLLDGTFGSRDVQVGAGPDDRLPVALGDLRPEALGPAADRTVAGVDVTTPEGARDALEVVDAALDQTNAMRAYAGAVTARLDAAACNLVSAAENHTAALSRLEDADVAAESTDLAAAAIRQNATAALHAQAERLGQVTLTLL